MTTYCPLCKNSRSKRIYTVNDLPVFQNIVFDTEAEALATQVVNVELEECECCGFVWNTVFDQSLMNYDKNYQNEQGFSKEFNKHLEYVVDLFIKRGYQGKNVVEVGCGKGVFLNKLKLAGFLNIKGYDPAFEGDNDEIIVDYFRKGSKTRNADLIVLRHVLEHIADPLGFLHTIAEANEYKGDIYIEVPDFDWIKRKGAFWDIFNEHCNYFSSDTIQHIFERSEVLSLFGEQYIGIFASLFDLKQSVTINHRFYNKFPSDQYELNRRIEEYRILLESKLPAKIILWGAASKGVIFANLLDKDRSKIDYLIDINPKKQGKFIGGTGHPIYPPPHISMIVVNSNYLNEIKDIINSNIEYITI